MELAAHTLSYCPNLSKSPTFSPSSSPTFIHHPNNYLFVHTSPPLLGICTFPKALQLTNPKTGGRLRSFGALHASETEIPSTADAERWLLEPVGDGDSRHIGFKVPMPNSFEIASSTVTIGRLPEKADLVIPVATVSGLHARIVKKEGSLLVTDLDSTNGTFIDDKRLRPGDAAPAFPGSCVIFGDAHLAMFRVSKLEIVEAPSQSEESNARISSETSSEAIG